MCSIEFSEFSNFNSVHSRYIGTIIRKINMTIMKSQGKPEEQIKYLMYNVILEKKKKSCSKKKY